MVFILRPCSIDANARVLSPASRKCFTTADSFAANNDFFNTVQTKLGDCLEIMETRLRLMRVRIIMELKSNASTMTQILKMQDGIEDCLEACAQMARDTDRIIAVNCNARPLESFDSPTSDEVHTNKEPGANENKTDNISTIKNYAEGDAMQFMISTSKKRICGKNISIRSRTRQVGGHLSDELLCRVIQTLKSNMSIPQSAPR